MFRFGLAALGLAGLATWAQAQDLAPFEIRSIRAVHLDDVHPEPEPGLRAVDLYVRVLSDHDEPVELLRPRDLEVREDERLIDLDDVQVQSLEDAGRAVSVVLAIDVSRTMRGEPLEQVRAASLDMLGRLHPSDRLAVVTFADSVDVLVPFSSSRPNARTALEGLDVARDSLRTVFFDGVRRSFELLRAETTLPRRSLVVVFSDGKDTGSLHSLEQALEMARGDERRPAVLCYAIGYARFGGEGLEAMRRLARGTGGAFLEAKSAPEVSRFYADVGQRIRKSYVIRYATSLDGEGHRVSVAIEGHSDSRLAIYPRVSANLWPWFAGLALLLAGAGLAVFLRARSLPGRLVFLEGPEAGTAALLRRGLTRIGALEDNDIVISSKAVSRYHAEIRASGRQVEIEDLNSSNGTEVNGKRIDACPLRPGDSIRIADVELMYER